MKIGILTFHKPINYGAFLQSFSFSEKLSTLFPDEVEIIDYVASDESSRIMINVLCDIKHYGIKTGFWYNIKKINAFKKSYSRLSLSKKNKFKDLKELYSYIDNNYDILIIGSDAVFNWKQNGYPSAFIPLYDFKKCKVVTYAASVHGLRYLEEARTQMEECATAFEKMKLIGVRDANTEKFVTYCNDNVKPVHCCDPTLFIDKKRIKSLAENYKERILKTHKCDLRKKYMVVMMPKSEMVKKIREKYSDEYQIITLFNPLADADYYLYDLTPFEWAAVLSEAAVVVTSYFHGCLLSLVQGTPAVAIDYSGYNDENYEGKLKDLFITRFCLPELYYDGKSTKNEDILNTVDEALRGSYDDRIKAATAKEAEEFEKFIARLKSDILRQN